MLQIPFLQNRDNNASIYLEGLFVRITRHPRVYEALRMGREEALPWPISGVLTTLNEMIFVKYLEQHLEPCM